MRHCDRTGSFYRALLDLASDLIAVVDAQGTILFANAASERIFGYPPQELVGRNGFEFVHPDDAASVREGLRETVAQPNTPMPATYRLRHKDGGYHFMEGVGINRLHEPDFNGIIISYRDVTEGEAARLHYEGNLKSSQKRLRNLVERSAFGTAMGFGDGSLTMANDAFLELVGYSREESEAGLLNWFRLTPDKWHRLDQAAIAEARRNGGCRPYQKEFLRKDGTRVPVLMCCAVLDDSDAMAAFAIDLSELKQAEKELARLARIVQSTSDAVLSLTPEGKILTWNPGAERLYGYSAQEIVGHPETDLIPDEVRDDFRQMTDAVLRGESLDHYETVRRRKDGTAVPVSLTVSPIRDADGRLVGISKIARDLTEAKRAVMMELQLQQAQKLEAVGRLAGGVAHDFNNMLMVIMNYTEMLQDRLPVNDPLRRNTHQILRAAQRAASVASQLLAFSRRQILQPELLDLNDLVRDTLGMLRRLIGEDIELNFKPAQFAAQVKIDPGQAIQILLNLCVNARDAMPQGGKILLETAEVYLDENYTAIHPPVCAGAYVMLSVTDTGTGIAPELRDKIFEPFFTTKEVGKGTGLGLATVYGIIKQSGGYIWVYSELGQGSTFKIYLPSMAGTASQEGASKALQLSRAAAAETVLLVEDEDALRTTIGEFLESIGYEVLLAASGAEALELAAQHAEPIHILLTDLVMPGMSGKELAERLSTARPQIKVLFMSGYTEEAISEHGILNVGVNLLQKPFAFKTLAQKLRQLSADEVATLS